MTSIQAEARERAVPATGGGEAVSLRNVRRTYPAAHGAPARVALDSVSLAVPRGQRVALLGPNGSGKSTLLRILATLDRPDRGEGTRVEILGRELEAGMLRGIRARIGVVFQNPGLDPLLTVRENLLAQAALVGVAGAAAKQRVEASAARLGLGDRLDDRVKTLSGGLVRRADLARALLHEPELLLLDEPTTGLDPRARAEFLTTVDAAAAGGNGSRMTVLTSTHLMDEAERAERVVFLHEGRIVADAPPGELRARLGGTVVRCHAVAGTGAEARVREILSGAGLDVTVDPNGTLVARSGGAGEPGGRGDPAVQRALIELVRAEIPFEVGPPTLGDAFLALTGTSLDVTEAASPVNGRGRRRGRRRR